MKDKELEAYEYANAMPIFVIKGTLDLWERVEQTNPKYTKKAKIGGHSITAIAPQYQIKMVTEQFGIYGETWGFKDIELSYDLVDKCNLVVFKGVFFFPKGEFEIINSCKLYMDRAQTMIDDNFAKKIETDALTKAISKLGFNADIFMGKFDDVRYVQEMNEKYKEEPKPEPLPNLPEKLFNLLFDNMGKQSKNWGCKVTVSEIEKRYSISKDYKDALEIREKETAPPIITDAEFEEEKEALSNKTVTLEQIKAKYVLSTVQEKALMLIAGLG